MGERIKQARIKLGFTQKQISDMLGIGDSAYSYYENDFKLPSVPILAKLCKVLNVSADYLLEPVWEKIEKNEV